VNSYLTLKHVDKGRAVVVVGCSSGGRPLYVATDEGMKFSLVWCEVIADTIETAAMAE
jgi:hypothetical protein